MITENLSTLKIHRLTQAQYDSKVADGTIVENELYLTPDKEIDLSIYATKDELEGLRTEIMSLISSLSEVKTYLDMT